MWYTHNHAICFIGLTVPSLQLKCTTLQPIQGVIFYLDHDVHKSMFSISDECYSQNTGQFPCDTHVHAFRAVINLKCHLYNQNEGRFPILQCNVYTVRLCFCIWWMLVNFSAKILGDSHVIHTQSCYLLW